VCEGGQLRAPEESRRSAARPHTPLAIVLAGAGDAGFRIGGGRLLGRDGGGAGRSYAMAYVATDGSGNSTSATTIVTVPHDSNGVTDPLLLSAQISGALMRLTWSPVPGAQDYQVVRGRIRNLQEMPEGIDLGALSCLSVRNDSTISLVSEDSETPLIGDAFFYVAAFRNGTTTSSFGSVFTGKPRLTDSNVCSTPGDSLGAPTAGAASPTQIQRDTR
jgi:hypothetical protein